MDRPNEDCPNEVAMNILPSTFENKSYFYFVKDESLIAPHSSHYQLFLIDTHRNGPFQMVIP